MRAISMVALFFAALVASPASGEPARQINTCFEELISALRLSQLEQGISHCDKVIDDKTATAERRGRALAQRGLMYARRWSIMSTPPHAFQAIDDITEALRLHSPTMARKHVLLIIRAQLYTATGQRKRAAEDYAAILAEDPINRTARDGQQRLGPPEGF